MSAETLTLAVPENLYGQLKSQAEKTARSMGDFVLQTLARSVSPPVEVDLPDALQKELQAMEHLSDQSLWEIAQGTMNPDQVALYDLLLERHKAGILTPAGRQWLAQLREEGEALMLRKAHAYVLLQSRGHTLPSLAELRGEPS